MDVEVAFLGEVLAAGLTLKRFKVCVNLSVENKTFRVAQQRGF